MAWRAQFAHIANMASRPCKPDADMKRLWRFLLPSTPFPACGVPEDSAAAHDNVKPESDFPEDAEPERKATR
jgi:hypothetical protein